MPARKPLNLSKKHLTDQERTEREEGEAAMVPITQLDLTPPPLLQKRKQARATWQRLVGLYFEVEGSIVTAFDADLLTKYCILEEECLTVEVKREEVGKNAELVNKLIQKYSDKKGKGKDLDIVQYLNLLQQYQALMTRWQGLDARLDGKRKLLHDLAKSLYLTPRSRAGVAPTQKTKEKPDGFSEFD